MPRFPPRTIEQHIQESLGAPMAAQADKLRNRGLDAVKRAVRAMTPYESTVEMRHDIVLEIRAAEQAARQDERRKVLEPTEEALEAVARAMCAHVESENELDSYEHFGYADAAEFVENHWPNYVSQARAAIRALKEVT